MQKILIVDDDPVMLRLASLILSKHYHTVTASSGAEAVKLFELEKPDMVLSDLLMPEMDGYELHRILQERSADDVPIMFMTADEDEDSERRGFDIGIDDFIRKPFKADVLLRRVENILKNSNKIRGLKQAVDIDAMTGLLNKSASKRQIGDLCSKKQGVLMMLDLDSFKLINDIYGHNIGDKILIRFAELIKEVIRSSDLAGRMGGDEFIVYCQSIYDEAIIAEKTEYLNEKIVAYAKELMGDDMNIPLGTSVGAVFIPNEGTDFSTLCKKADKALYTVKQKGKHGYAFYGETNSKDLSQQNMSNMSKILGERNREPGAYFVEFAHFKTIYQLSVRLIENYQRELQLLYFKIDPELEIVIEKFKETLIKTLRRSDCITQNGQNQFLVLLMEASAEESEIVRQRIINNWNQTIYAAKTHVIFNRESVKD